MAPKSLGGLQSLYLSFQHHCAFLQFAAILTVITVLMDTEFILEPADLCVQIQAFGEKLVQQFVLFVLFFLRCIQFCFHFIFL